MPEGLRETSSTSLPPVVRPARPRMPRPARDDADIAIATVADRRFLPPACCQIASTARNLDSGTRARLFLVLCDVSEQDVLDSESFFASRGIAAEVIVPDFVDKMMPPLKTRWPRAAYLRLYFDWLFDKSWRRVVYLDADTRVCAPLAPLLDADLAGKPIGAVHDFVYYVTGHIHRRRRDLFLAEDAPYFQSGVMVFDWPEMLRCDGLAAARRFLQEYPESCREAPDQDALNATFHGRWTPLDPRWNFHELYLMFGQGFEPKIQHFTSTKPWSGRRPRAWREAAAWYQAELEDSPWADFVEPQGFLGSVRADVHFKLRRYGPHIRAALSRYAPGLLRLLRRESDIGRRPWVPRRARDVEEMASALLLEAEGKTPPLRPPEAVLSHGHW